MTRILFTTSDLDARDRRLGRVEWLKGVGVGCFLGGCAMLLIAWVFAFSLDTYRNSLYQRDIKAAANVGNECMELWNATQPESYANAVNTMSRSRRRGMGDESLECYRMDRVVFYCSRIVGVAVSGKC